MHRFSKKQKLERLKAQSKRLINSLPPEKILRIYRKLKASRKKAKDDIEEFQKLPTTLPEYEEYLRDCG